MPSTTIRVKDLSGFGDGFWTINGFDAQNQFQKFTTNNAWKASLCRESMLSGRPVEIQWRDTAKWGRDIVFVDYAQEAHAS